MLRKKAFESF